jgi:hypothetical protein
MLYMLQQHYKNVLHLRHFLEGREIERILWSDLATEWECLSLAESYCRSILTYLKSFTHQSAFYRLRRLARKT